MSADKTTPVETNHGPMPLVRALSEIEQHVRPDGWDQPPRLYALAETGDLIAREPELADQLGIDLGSTLAGSLTPIEQEVGSRSLEDLLTSIAWPETVDGCALAVERIVLPPGAEDDMPDDETAAVTWAQQHPSRTDVRVIVGVLRDGTHTSVLRVRGHDADTDLIVDAELSPELSDALMSTFA